jgi:hypothetical protein
MSTTIPRNLQVFLTTLGAGISKTTIKLFPQGKSGPFVQNENTRIVLPENSVIDLHSLSLMFLATTTTATGFAGLPKHSSSLISRVNVSVGGLQVGHAINEYNTLYNCLANVLIGEDKLTEMSVLEGGIVGDSFPAPTANVTNRRMAVNNWLGLLSGDMGRFLDTSLTGSIMIDIQWAPNAVLPIGATGTGVAYSVSDVYMIVESISFEGALYSNLLLSKMATGQPLQIPFRNWALMTSQTNTTAATIPFSVNSRSIDVLAASLRPNDYDGTPVAIPGSTTNSNYFRLFSDGSNSTFQWTVNGQQYPQWPASTADAYILARNAFDGSSGNNLFANSVRSLSRWENGHFLFAVSLSHHTSPDDHLMSGLNTMGTATQIYFSYQNGATGSGTRPVILVGCTSVLEVYPGRQVLYIA